VIKSQTTQLKNYFNNTSTWLGIGLILQGQIINIHLDSTPPTYDVYLPRWQMNFHRVPILMIGGIYWSLQQNDIVMLAFADGRKDVPIIIGKLPILNNKSIIIDSSQMTIKNPAGANIILDPQGNILLNGGTAGIARVGDSVQVNVNGTIYTGTITSGSNTVKSG
jgi:hypothetical protein